MAKVGAAIEAVKKCDTFLAAVRNRDHAQPGWMAMDRRKQECQEALFVMADALSQAPLHIFGWILKVLSGAGLMVGRTVGVDGPFLKAKVGVRSVVKMVAVSNDTQASGEYLRPAGRD